MLTGNWSDSGYIVIFSDKSCREIYHPEIHPSGAYPLITWCSMALLEQPPINTRGLRAEIHCQSSICSSRSPGAYALGSTHQSRIR